MTNVSLSSPGAEDAWVEDTVTELTMEASHEEGEEVTPSPVSLLYTEFRKYVSMKMDRLSESECLNLGHMAEGKTVKSKLEHCLKMFVSHHFCFGLVT